MALRLAVYLRKSSKDREDKQAHSIERQRRDIDDYLEKHEKFEDNPLKKLIFNSDNDLFYEDASAKFPGRERFNQMVNIIQKRKYDVLLCTDFSRLSRNAIDNGVVVQLLEDCHLKEIRSLDKAFTTSPTDIFMLSMLLMISKYENDQRALNTSSGMSNRRASGATTFKAPMGYINCGEEKGKRWVESDGENFIKVRRLWELFLMGTYTVEALKNEAVILGVTVLRSKGKRFSPTLSTIRNMLSNRYYLGEIKQTDKNGFETWIKGQHEAMVDLDEFEKIQYILQKSGYKHIKLDRAPNIIEIIKAIAVSGVYSIKDSTGHTRPASLLYENKTRYICSQCKYRFSSNKPKSCPKCNTEFNKSTKVLVDERFSHYTQDRKKKDSVKVSVIIDFLERELMKLTISEGLFQVLRKQLYTLWLEKHKTVGESRKKLKVTIEKLEEERGDLYRKKFVEEGSSNDVKFAIKSVEKELGEQEQLLEDLKEKHEEDFDRAWQSLQVLRDAKEILGSKIEFEPKKRLLLSLVSSLVFYKDKIEVIWQKPFDVLVKKGIDKTAGSAGPTKCLDKNLFGSPDWARTNDLPVTLISMFP
ncbi:recombinase family protein [Candidatus Peregrinibacteria bacterium]|nr:recombinase family protein [Candidatus Peregrinibacteria bacterium]